MPLLGGTFSSMQKYKHLSLEERKAIEYGLGQSFSFKRIAKSIGRSATTVTREVTKNSFARQSGAFGSPFNNCANRFGCTVQSLCSKPDCRRKGCAGAGNRAARKPEHIAFRKRFGS